MIGSLSLASKMTGATIVALRNQEEAGGAEVCGGFGVRKGRHAAVEILTVRVSIFRTTERL